MSAKAASLLEAALELPADEREHLVEELNASLIGNASGFASKEIEAAWAAEINRRAAEIDAGTAVLHNWTEARDKLLAELRARR